VDAVVKRFVAVLVLAGCASGTDPRLGHDANTSEPDGPIDAMVDAPDACVPTPEICDGVDNDCDGQIDEDFHVGMPCDGPDADHCAEGMIVCAGPNATMCTDTTGDSVEICDGIDNDCDGQIDEGFNVGTACDGPDTDLCKEGVIACDTGGGTKCTDATGDSVEACNGLDDDCDGSVDETFPVGQACSVGLGACLRSGTLVCNAMQTGTQCSASAGAPSAETCGNGVDEDCNGSDATCPSNDLPGGAMDISAGGTWTADVSAAHDDNWAASTATMDCGNQGGRDVFYQFTLPAEEVVYFDSYGSNFDTVIRVFAGACTAIGATMACSDDQCGTTRSQGAVDLAAGTYCLVLDQWQNTVTAGAATLTFKRGGRAGVLLASGTTSYAGTTTGKTDLSVASCEANTHQPDVAHFFTTCPGANTISASTCTGTAFDTIIYMKTGSATSGDIACSDDQSGCGNGLQSQLTNVSVVGANLNFIIVDGFGTTGNGAYTLSYTIP
jgi:hypothetical protein